MINNTRELTKEFMRRSGPMELKVECPSDGNFHSQVAIVAEAPGEHEVRQRKPLVGGSGTLLWSVLRKIDFNKTMAYVTNVSKRRGGTPGRRPPVGGAHQEMESNINKHELDQWKAMLAWGRYYVARLCRDWRHRRSPRTLRHHVQSCTCDA